MLEIRLLGQFNVEAEGQPVEMPSRPAQSLLAYLALHAGTAQRREKLAGMFWPEATESNARNNLRHALWRIRKAIGASFQTGRDYLEADDLTITFETNGDCWLDTAILEQKSSESESTDAWIEAVSVYRGDLLPGFYDEWVVLERERLQAIFERKMQMLLERLLEARRWPETLEWGERWIALGHTPEPAYRALMVAHSGLGDRSSVVAVYQRCVEALRQELGVEPSEQTRELYERLFRGDTPPFSPPTGLSGQAIGPYRVVEKLGAGGMAEVYKAYQPRLDRYVALKFIRPDLTDAEGFRPRFEREAKLLAKLNHPHIVHIYDFGEQGRHCYLAMEYVAGGTLKEWLRSLRLAGQALTPEQALVIVQQVSAALDYAHQQGIIHRDIKPANIMLTPDGRALLSDFGIAKLISTAGDASETSATTGTPAYMSPEQISGGAEKIGPPSDVYSLGVVLYEMLTGQTPFITDTPMAMMLKQVQEMPPPPRGLNPALPPAVDDVLLKALAKEPAARYQGAGELVQAFQAALAAPSVSAESEATLLRGAWWPPGPDESPAPGEPPFKGLPYFDEADADLFFGRELLTANLVGRLGDAPSQQESKGAEEQGREISPAPITPAHFLAVVGASGSGKSSLVRAGLIPAFKGGQPLADGSLPPEGSARWPIHVITPTAHPLESLAASLTCDSESVTATATLMDDLARDPRSLRLYVRRLLNLSPSPLHGEGRGGGRLLLVVDQFEELFTLCQNEAEHRAFVNNLLTATGIAAPKDEDNSSTFQPVTLVVITLRADFYAHCAQFDSLREALAKYQEYIGPMNTAELRRAIEEPAKQGGWTFEPGLVDFLLEEVGAEPGALPLLSHALLETWQRRRGRTLTFGGYRESGGVRGAIAKTADRVWTQFGPEQQTIARNIFLRLTELGEGTQDTRRRVGRVELEALTTADQRPPTAEEFKGEQTAVSGQPSAVALVLHTLADARLITTGEDSVEVAHEALIREWPLLRQWLDENREDLYLHRHLTEAAQAWTKLNRDPGELYRGARLAQASEWAQSHAEEMNALERDFLAASQELARQGEAEREAQGQRELEAVQRLAEAEQRRAEERGQAARRLGWLASGLAVFLLLAIGAAWFASNERSIAQRNAAEAQNLAMISGSQAALANGDTDQAISLALQAATLDPLSAQVQVALGEAAYAPGTIRRFVGHTDAIDGVALSPDGHTALTASHDKTLMLWDIQTGQMIGHFEGHTDKVTSVAFSPDGLTALSGSVDKTLILWDIQTGQIIRHFQGYMAEVWTVAISPDGRTALSGGADKTLILWDIQTGEIIRRFEGHSDAVESVQFSPDSHTALSGSDDQTLILWDIETGQIIHRFEGHTGEVNSVAFSPDGKTALSGVNDVIMILWDLETGQMIRRFSGNNGWVTAVAFSPDGQRALSGSPHGTLVLWDIATGQPLSHLHGHKWGTNSVVFSQDGRTALSASDDGTMRLWDLEGGQVIRRFSGLEVNGEVAYNPVGRERTALVGLTDGAIVLDPETGQEIRRITTSDVVAGVAYSPDGRTALLATGQLSEEPSDVILWDVETGQEIRRFVGHPVGVHSVDFSPDGRTAVSSGGKGVIILWDVATGQEIRRFRGYEGDDWGDKVFSVVFSPDERSILTSFGSGNLILWDVATGQEIRRFVGHTAMIIHAVFSPDGQHAFSGAYDNTAVYWDVATGSIIRRLTDHSAAVFAVELTPDGRFGLGGSADNTTTLWDLKTGEVIRRYTGLNADVNNVAFSPDGHEAIVNPFSGDLALWRIDITLDELLAWTHANRYILELTCAQRALYKLEPLCLEDAATPTGEATPASK